MKHFLTICLFCIILLASCDIFISGHNDFDFADPLKMKVGETLYEDNNTWIRLDSVVNDNRSFLFEDAVDTNYAECWFTFGGSEKDSSIMVRSEHGAVMLGDVEFKSIEVLMDSLAPCRPRNGSLRQSDYTVWLHVFEYEVIAYKPNIYLYPKVQTELNVALKFLKGGHVSVSDPQYPDAWQHITATPNGRISGQYDFLFYEAALDDHWQRRRGWCVPQTDLKLFFTTTMKDYGFVEAEIHDFIEYWIPRLQETPYYNIYPQTKYILNRIIKLQINESPQSLLRVFFVIDKDYSHREIKAPHMKPFIRKGFTVTEWGVVL